VLPPRRIGFSRAVQSAHSISELHSLSREAVRALQVAAEAVRAAAISDSPGSEHREMLLHEAWRRNSIYQQCAYFGRNADSSRVLNRGQAVA
jgi:hypothetical protein